MIKISISPYRLALAIIATPVMLVLSIALVIIGIALGDHVYSMYFELALDDPWLLIPIAAIGPTLMFMAIVHLMASKPTTVR